MKRQCEWEEHVDKGGREALGESLARDYHLTCPSLGRHRTRKIKADTPSLEPEGTSAS